MSADLWLAVDGENYYVAEIEEYHGIDDHDGAYIRWASPCDHVDDLARHDDYGCGNCHDGLMAPWEQVEELTPELCARIEAWARSYDGMDERLRASAARVMAASAQSRHVA